MRDRFAREYLKDFNATQAAIRAGYSAKTAASQGQRLLKSPGVGTRIARDRAKLLGKEESSVENTLRGLATMAFMDPGQLLDKNGIPLPIHRMPEEARRCANVEIEELFESRSGRKRSTGHHYKLSFTGKIKALAMLGKYVKMFPKTGRARQRGKPRNPAEQLSIEQVDAILDGSIKIQTQPKPPPLKRVGQPPSRVGMKGRGSFMRDRFAIEYLKDFNATQASVRAGYSEKTAASQGQRLLKSAGVGKAIADAAAKPLEKTEVTAERVREELEAIAFLDAIECLDDKGNLLPINKMPENVRRAITSFTIKGYDCECHRHKKAHVYSFKICDCRTAALELLWKAIAYAVTQPDSQISIERLRKIFAEVMSAPLLN